MQSSKLKNAPIVYFMDKSESTEWIVFLHAAFVDHRMFCKQAEYFKGKYNILIPDLLGHGRSTDTQKGDSIEKMSAWLKEILEIENIEKIHLVGVSLGAVLAQDFANHYPESVMSLACFGGYDINNFPSEMQKENGAAQMKMMLKALLSVKWFAKENKQISAYTPEAQAAFYEMNVQFPKKSFMYLSSLSRMVNTCRTAPRKYALLIGCGEHDLPMELSAVKLWRDSEACRAVIFRNAGHCVNMDVPQQFNAVMEAFLAGESLPNEFVEVL